MEFHQKKLGNHKQGINVSEIEIYRAKIVHKNAICNAFNKSLAEMGNYSLDFVPLNIHNLNRCSRKFNFRVLTLKEIYKVINSLENSKSLGPGIVHAWALKAAKYGIGTHLQVFFLTNVFRTVSFKLF